MVICLEECVFEPLMLIEIPMPNSRFAMGCNKPRALIFLPRGYECLLVEIAVA